MPSRSVKFTLKIKDCSEVFSKELGPGVVVSEVLTITHPDPEALEGDQFIMKLVEAKKAFIDRCVDVGIEEVKE